MSGLLQSFGAFTAHWYNLAILNRPLFEDLNFGLRGHAGKKFGESDLAPMPMVHALMPKYRYPLLGIHD
jgi:hypothetical protein